MNFYVYGLCKSVHSVLYKYFFQQYSYILSRKSKVKKPNIRQ